MAQTSYGTITITDTTDIESIVVEYAQNQDPLTAPINGWGTTRPEWAEGYYIWQRTRTHKYGTSSSADDIGVAVCITGSQGETGRSLTSTTTQYTTAVSSATITTDNMGDYIWYTNIPSYNNSTPVYWVRVTNIYSNPSTGYLDVYSGEVVDGSGSSNGSNSSSQNNSENNITTVYIIYKDEGLTSAVSMSQTALTQSSSNINTIIRLWYRSNSATAPSKPTSHITQSGNNVDNTWTTTKPIDKDGYRYYYYCDELCTGGGVYKWTDVVLDTSNLSQYEIGALTTKVKNFWWDTDGAHVASGKNGSEVTTESSSTYGYNSLMGLTGISFGYDDTKVVDLTTTSPALSFYLPPVFNNNVASQGNKVMQLSNNALTFYNPSDGTTAYATLNANGLKLAKGGIQAGTANQSGFIYLSTDNYGNYSINNSSGISDWKQIIGTKFGVRADGTLYASNANISGTITIGSGSNVYTKTEADNAFDASGDAAAAQAAAIAAAATDATNKANAAQANAIAEIPTNISELTNDSGYQTSSEVSSAIENATAGKADNSMAVYREQRIYRRYTSVQSNLSGPTTWITTNGDTYSDWTTKVPQLTNDSTKYPYLYTCIQKQTVAQYNNGSGTSCTCTEVLLDDTTTVIDGGALITGSITANEITGNKLSAIYADMGNITAGNITKGNNSINFDNSPATLEFKNASTWSAATQGIKYDSNGLAIKGAITATSLTLGSDVQIPASTAISGLSTVATTGSYNDLSNKPTVPDLTKYITKISDTGITIHPEVYNGSLDEEKSSRIQLDGTGMNLLDKNGNSIAQYGSTARVGLNNSSRFLMNSNSLEAYDSNNVKYFEVTSSGLSWGSNTAATTNDLENAAKTATNYITYINSENGIRIYDGQDINEDLNYAQINSTGMQIYRNNEEVASFGHFVRVGADTDNSAKIFINPSNNVNGLTNMLEMQTRDGVSAFLQQTDDNRYVNVGTNLGFAETVYTMGSQSVSTTSSTKTASFTVASLQQLSNDTDFTLTFITQLFGCWDDSIYPVRPSPDIYNVIFDFTKGISKTLNITQVEGEGGYPRGTSSDAETLAGITHTYDVTYDGNYTITLTSTVQQLRDGVPSGNQYYDTVHEQYEIDNIFLARLKYDADNKLMPVLRLCGDIILGQDGIGSTFIELDIDSDASPTTDATYGKDKNLFNIIRNLNWYNPVISGIILNQHYAKITHTSDVIVLEATTTPPGLEVTWQITPEDAQLQVEDGIVSVRSNFGSIMNYTVTASTIFMGEVLSDSCIINTAIPG